MGASGINPVGSMMVLRAVFVRLVSVSSGRNVIVSVFAMASRSAVLEVRRHPKAWSFVECGTAHAFFCLVDDGELQLALDQQCEGFVV